MGKHKIVSHQQWIEARKQLFAKEKAFTRARDALSQERRALPWERVEKNYMCAGPNGEESLGDLFAGQSQLIVYHFHVRSDLGGRLQELLVLGGQLQQHRCALEAPRRDISCHLRGPIRQARSLQETHGVELQMGVLI
jgi:predicted dithiol-disulfide oxidoreductase (DUF899 family)